MLFGGYDGESPREETWIFDDSGWSASSVVGPSARFGAVMARLDDEVVLFGGTSGSVLFDDTWSFNGQAGRRLAIQGPPPRNFAAFSGLPGSP